jgi:ABC-type multidrug transport system fused ATPase/permease subunit
MSASDFLLLAAILGSLLPVFLLVYFLKNRLKSWGQTLSTATQQMIQTLNQGLGGFKETRIIGSAPYFEAQMAVHTKEYARAAALVGGFDMLPRILIETSLVIFIVSFVGAAQIFQFRSTESLISSLGIFAVASIRLLPAASQLIGAAGNLQSTRHVVDILYRDLKEVNKHPLLYQNPKDSSAKNRLSFSENSLKFSNKIQISGISYRYSEDVEPAISKISLEIEKGKSIAFIGKSGAGKTTLVDIILGLLIPQGGNITVDGVSIYDDLRAWQNLVGYIPQSIFLLDDTVERNIAFGVADHLIDQQKLESAIASAQLQELIFQLPNGLNTRVGERGVMLSGGQRQRIGIARALYHEREILVLDEATSALDNETEKRVSEAISQLSGKKTLIMIAHRLSTVEQCDKIYLLEKGKIVNSGSYQEVVGRKK